ncbi:MAG: type IV toxin-antitoxin system AbiEi family antitoxin domain-containing protein [Chitinispirillales bacterium]|nr:type IV toxin-antitoxin system AbiEi family antitoxin domain-containing protein [Chitinispirillales bacterium]
MSQQDFVCRRKAAVDQIKARNGWIRMSEAMSAGISRRMLYTLRDDGVIESVSRGVYRLVGKGSLSQPDKATVALRAPGAVLCLTSALLFHEITTQIPSAVDIAVLSGTAIPRISYPPVRVYRLREPSFSAGVAKHIIDGVTVKIYDVEKTLCDCFKFRKHLGMDVVLEALKLYRERKSLKVSNLMKYARICRVEKIIRPYIEATL